MYWNSVQYFKRPILFFQCCLTTSMEWKRVVGISSHQYVLMHISACEQVSLCFKTCWFTSMWRVLAEKVHVCILICPHALKDLLMTMAEYIEILLSRPSKFVEFLIYGQQQASWIQANQRKIPNLYCVPWFIAPTCCLPVFLLLSYIKWYVCMTQVAC